MRTLKEQLEAEAARSREPAATKAIEPETTPRFGNPYREEYLKSAAAIQEKLLKRGKPARPSKKKAMR
jgi:hypothetical protein